MYEFGATIPTLWDSVKEFVKEHPEYVAPNNAIGYMSEDGGNSYNNCHCASPFPSRSWLCSLLTRPECLLYPLAVWSNFEIADMDFWRSEAYTKFFEHLDKKGGFYYEVRPSLPFFNRCPSLC